MFFVLRPSISGNFFKEWIHFWTSLRIRGQPAVSAGFVRRDLPVQAQQGPVPLVLATPGRIQLFTVQLNLAF